MHAVFSEMQPDRHNVAADVLSVKRWGYSYRNGNRERPPSLKITQLCMLRNLIHLGVDFLGRNVLKLTCVHIFDSKENFRGHIVNKWRRGDRGEGTVWERVRSYKFIPVGRHY